jgi:transcriptional regulator GlxA family with amidase domain
MSSDPRHISVVLFEGFELLDVFGPVELFSRFPEELTVSMLGPQPGSVTSSQGTAVIADEAYADAALPDIVLVPGGMGTRRLVGEDDFLGWLRDWARNAQIVSSVCTGSAVLAAAGLLDGYRATSNKLAFSWASSQGGNVEWVPQARWVEDRNRWTSSGVAAGMDMTAALLGTLFGASAARDAADHIELELHTDANWDPYAELRGLA